MKAAPPAYRPAAQTFGTPTGRSFPPVMVNGATLQMAGKGKKSSKPAGKTETKTPAKKAHSASDPVTLSDTQKLAITAAIAAADAEKDSGGQIDNDAQVALKDAMVKAVGGSNPTHNRGGGHRGSSVGKRSVQNTLSDVPGLTEGYRVAINAYLNPNESKTAYHV
jgi:hypothetical protein